jgi:hypothetical protein
MRVFYGCRLQWMYGRLEIVLIDSDDASWGDNRGFCTIVVHEKWKMFSKKDVKEVILDQETNILKLRMTDGTERTTSCYTLDTKDNHKTLS